MLSLFGTVFSFVNSDVVSKISILRAYRCSGHAEDYDTMDGMLDYELRHKLTASKEKASGARTLLRLHRALDFVVEMLQELRKGDDSSKMSVVFTQAYDRTLSKHHPWLIRKGVHVAFYMLPSRHHLLQKMHLFEEERTQAVLKDVIAETKVVYDTTQVLYSERKLLDLP